MTLGRSRRSYLEFALSADIYGLITCLINAFFYFGGLTDVFLTDCQWTFKPARWRTRKLHADGQNYCTAKSLGGCVLSPVIDRDSSIVAVNLERPHPHS